MTDAEKHLFAQARGYPHALIVPSALYAELERMGDDMRMYVIQKPIPVSPMARRYIRECSGPVCMPARNGRCGACCRDPA